jgi:hypothetical protein
LDAELPGRIAEKLTNPMLDDVKTLDMRLGRT